MNGKKYKCKTCIHHHKQKMRVQFSYFAPVNKSRTANNFDFKFSYNEAVEVINILALEILTIFINEETVFKGLYILVKYISLFTIFKNFIDFFNKKCYNIYSK